MEGTVVADRYEVIAALGSGATATVYRARDRKLGREVALKLLHEIPHELASRRFEREVRIASGFRHADVIEVYDVGSHQGRPFVTMEMVTVPSLANAIIESIDPPTITAVAEVASRIAGLLAAAHAGGLVHRDLKPANVFVEGPLAAPVRCRLSDFGLAFMVEPESETLGRFTVEGTLLGTPLYMAPEQAEGKNLSGAVDVYSLGCMIHEMVSGRPPFIGDIARVLAGHMYLPPVALRELESEAPAELERLVLEMLAKDPAARPAASACATRLAAIAASTTGARSTTLLPRHLRALAPPADEARPADRQPVVVLAVDDADLAAGLRARGIRIAERREDEIDAPLAIAPTADAGRVWIAVRTELTPAIIARAIHDGAAGVVRWPGPVDAVAAHVMRAWRSIRRVP